MAAPTPTARAVPICLRKRRRELCSSKFIFEPPLRRNHLLWCSPKSITSFSQCWPHQCKQVIERVRSVGCDNNAAPVNRKRMGCRARAERDRQLVCRLNEQVSQRFKPKTTYVLLVVHRHVKRKGERVRLPS